MIVESFLRLGDSVTTLGLGDGVSSLLLSIDIIDVDHQWDNKIIPVEGDTIAYDVENEQYYLVMKILRYNRSPAHEYQYACSLHNVANGINGVGDVWYEDGDWFCKTYNPVRYRDSDGVLKNL